jgi:hypothetical protein
LGNSGFAINSDDNVRFEAKLLCIGAVGANSVNLFA